MIFAIIFETISFVISSHALSFHLILTKAKDPEHSLRSECIGFCLQNSLWSWTRGECAFFTLCIPGRYGHLISNISLWSWKWSSFAPKWRNVQGFLSFPTNPGSRKSPERTADRSQGLVPMLSHKTFLTFWRYFHIDNLMCIFGRFEDSAFWAWTHLSMMCD